MPEGRVKRMKKRSRGKIVFLIIILVIGCIFISKKVIETKYGWQNEYGQYVMGYNTTLLNKEPYIGELHIKGVISSDSQGGSQEQYSQKWLIKRINDMTLDKNNKGIFLNIDSPGGELYAIDEMYLHLKEYKKKTGRPIYSYIGNLGASGGYYLASVSDRIIINRNGSAGSIGVITGTMYDLTGLMKKLGIKTETFHSGRNKAMGNPFCKMTGEQKKIIQGQLDEAYDSFVDIISKERGITKGKTRKLADGSVYTAKESKKNGLVDDIVPLYEDARVMVKKLSGVSNVKIIDMVHCSSQPGYMERLMSEFGKGKDLPKEYNSLKTVSPEASGIALLEKYSERNGRLMMMDPRYADK